MPELLQRPADNDSTEIEAGQRLSAQERFWGIDAGQELEVVDVSEETADGEYPEELTLAVVGEETWAGPANVPYHGDDLRSAVEAGALELN